MLASGRSETEDAVVMSQIIADSMLADMRSSATDIEPLNVMNLLRVLDIYAANASYVPTPIGILEQDSFADSNHINEAQSFKRLKNALQNAHHAVSPERTSADFVAHIRQMLLAYINDPSASSDKINRTELDRFLSELTTALANV